MLVIPRPGSEAKGFKNAMSREQASVMGAEQARNAACQRAQEIPAADRGGSGAFVKEWSR